MPYCVPAESYFRGPHPRDSLISSPPSSPGTLTLVPLPSQSQRLSQSASVPLPSFSSVQGAVYSTHTMDGHTSGYRCVPEARVDRSASGCPPPPPPRPQPNGVRGAVGYSQVLASTVQPAPPPRRPEPAPQLAFDRRAAPASPVKTVPFPPSKSRTAKPPQFKRKVSPIKPVRPPFAPPTPPYVPFWSMGMPALMPTIMLSAPSIRRRVEPLRVSMKKPGDEVRKDGHDDDGILQTSNDFTCFAPEQQGRSASMDDGACRGGSGSVGGEETLLGGGRCSPILYGVYAHRA